MTQVADPAIYAAFSASPSGDYFLVRERVKPYSYLVPDGRFPERISVISVDGELVRELPGKSLQEAIAIGGVQTGPRNFSWMEGEDHSVVYVDALDRGDPRVDVAHRDRLMQLDLEGSPLEVLRTEFRFAGLSVSGSGTGFLSEYDQPSRTRRLWRVEMDDPSAKTLLWERNAEDRYGDPGAPVTMLDDAGHRLVHQDGDWIFLSGAGASDQGDRPFLDRYNIETGESERLWRAGTDSYETLVAVLDEDATRILTRHESRTQPPNYYVRDLSDGQRTALTRFADPHPQLSGIEKRFVTYERSDGVQLSATLLLPPEYQEGKRLPVVVWAYPREYSNAAVAGQVRGNPNRFTRIGGMSHLFFLTQGYAVFDAATMPIVGGNLANDTYVEQLVASGQAAVDELVEMGVGDRDRIGIGGHSYGAFMTANILAHSDAYRAGIARSGAYNRTLTPFGFQNERRTYWEAPEVYFNMSPFMAADQVNEPILMIHGVADNNSGTFPIQSERMYAALKGNGATARLIMLPNESHGYRARESVMHTLAEMVDWFDLYVKNAEPRRLTF
jgi:dipeptidyl aminopeptidase/acylaminoacyl peptidase